MVTAMLEFVANYYLWGQTTEDEKETAVSESSKSLAMFPYSDIEGGDYLVLRNVQADLPR